MIKYSIDFSENECVFDEKHLPKYNISMQLLNVRCPLESLLSLSRSREGLNEHYIMVSYFKYWKW